MKGSLAEKVVKIFAVICLGWVAFLCVWYCFVWWLGIES